MKFYNEDAIVRLYAQLQQQRHWCPTCSGADMCCATDAVLASYHALFEHLLPVYWKRRGKEQSEVEAKWETSSSAVWGEALC